MASLSNGRLALCFSSHAYHWMGSCSILPSGRLFFVCYTWAAFKPILWWLCPLVHLAVSSSCESVSISAFQFERLLPLRPGSGRKESPSDNCSSPERQNLVSCAFHPLHWRVYTEGVTTAFSPQVLNRPASIFSKHDSRCFALLFISDRFGSIIWVYAADEKKPRFPFLLTRLCLAEYVQVTVLLW